MKFARYVFWTAAAWGVLVTLPLFFSEQKMGIDYPPPINHAEYYYSFAAVTMVWQILFVFIALNPSKYRSVMIFCALEKMSLLPAFAILFPQIMKILTIHEFLSFCVSNNILCSK